MTNPNASTRSALIRVFAGGLGGLALASSLALAAEDPHQASELDLPYIGEPADRSLSPLQEHKIGQGIYHQLLAYGLIVEDPELTTYVAKIGQRLSRHAIGESAQLTFFVINDPNINAFALPGGFIGIHTGLLTAADSESELASVLAHEIAHVTQRHIARQIDANKGWELAGLGLMLAALLAGGGDADVAQAALGIGMSLSAQRQINFTRSHELEADRIGIRTLSSAGFDASGMATFFLRLEQQARLYGDGVPEILRTHPVNTTRISEAQARAAALPFTKPAESEEFGLMRARARVLTAKLNGDAVAHFRDSERVSKSLADRYGLALALTRSGHGTLADELYRELLKARPNNVYFQLAHARNQLLSGSPDEGLALLHKARRDHPKETATTLSLADALIRTSQSAAARQLLIESDLLLRQNPEAYRLLAIAARDMNQRAEAHFQMAAYERTRGNYTAALSQLRAALRLPDLSQHDQQRLNARFAEYWEESPEAARKKQRQDR